MFTNTNKETVLQTNNPPIYFSRVVVNIGDIPTVAILCNSSFMHTISDSEIHSWWYIAQPTETIKLRQSFVSQSP